MTLTPSEREQELSASGGIRWPAMDKRRASHKRRAPSWAEIEAGQQEAKASAPPVAAHLLPKRDGQNAAS
jgi:hypothetical protein